MIDISWKQAMLGVTAMVMLTGILRPSMFDEPVKVTSSVVTPAPTPEKVVVVKEAAANQPDGYMTIEQCARVPNGMQVADLIYKFGWPGGDHGFNRFGNQFYFPVHDREDVCLVEFDDNKVTATIYQER